MPPSDIGVENNARARLRAAVYAASSATNSLSSSAKRELTLRPRRAAMARAFFSRAGSIARVMLCFALIHVKYVKSSDESMRTHDVREMSQGTIRITHCMIKSERGSATERPYRL